jgi:uncharacterized protein
MVRDDAIFHDAETGNPYAGLGVAYMYHHGKDVEQNNEMAMDWYMRAAENGCSRAKWELAKAFRDGTIVQADVQYYLYYIKKAASAGIPEARLELALLNLDGVTMPKNPHVAFNWMRLAADQNLPMAEFLLGYMYGQGIGTEMDKAEEELLYSKVGIHGNADLFYWIGRNYEYGLIGVKRDLFEAGRWYKYGADMGHEACYISWQSVLDVLNEGEEESLQDREFRLSHTEAAKERTKRDTALAYADVCLDSDQYDEAVENYKEAADLGDPIAMYTLALIYHDGYILKRSDSTSLDYMKKASMAGSEDAQFIMGTLYERGRGVPKDINEAIYYFSMAAAHGYLPAYYRLSKYMEHPEIYVRNTMPVVIR